MITDGETIVYGGGTRSRPATGMVARQPAGRPSSASGRQPPGAASGPASPGSAHGAGYADPGGERLRRLESRYAALERQLARLADLEERVARLEEALREVGTRPAHPGRRGDRGEQRTPRAEGAGEQKPEAPVSQGPTSSGIKVSLYAGGGTTAVVGQPQVRPM